MTAFLYSTLVFAATVSCQRYLFSFGDSYTTTYFDIYGEQPSLAPGGNPIGNPVFPGITTDGGANWVGVVTAEGYSTLTYNFAIPGAMVNNSITLPGDTTPDLVQQCANFVDIVVPPPATAQWNGDNSIFAIWFGVNDIFHSFDDNPSPDPQIFETYTDQLSILYEAGARRFVLFSAPPFYLSPEFNPAADGAYSAAQSLVELSIESWNTELSSLATAFMQSHAGSNATVFNTADVFIPILNDPEAYGAPNNTCYNSNGVSCLWWDGLHPGQEIQGNLGFAFVNTAYEMGFYG